LRRGRYVLQLSTHHPRRREGLRPRAVDHRARRLGHRCFFRAAQTAEIGVRMSLHFTREELAERRRRTVELMQKRGLDGLLMFRQESMFYLTGYDTFGYVFFQCLYLGADGRLMLLTRAPDLLQAKHTSIIEDIRIWVDGPDAQPATELREVLRGLG